jgi:hypothetical protein
MDVVVSETRQVLRLGKKQDFGRIISSPSENVIARVFRHFLSQHCSFLYRLFKANHKDHEEHKELNIIM